MYRWQQSTSFGWYIVITSIRFGQVLHWLGITLGSTMFEWSKFSNTFTKTSTSRSFDKSFIVVRFEHYFEQRLIELDLFSFFFRERTNRTNFKDQVNAFSTACRGIDYSGTSSSKIRWFFFKRTIIPRRLKNKRSSDWRRRNVSFCYWSSLLIRLSFLNCTVPLSLWLFVNVLIYDYFVLMCWNI